MNEPTMEERIQALHETIKSIFPDAVYVQIEVNGEGITVEPRFKTNISLYTSMKKIGGGKVRQRPYLDS